MFKIRREPPIWSGWLIYIGEVLETSAGGNEVEILLFLFLPMEICVLSYLVSNASLKVEDILRLKSFCRMDSREPPAAVVVVVGEEFLD